MVERTQYQETVVNHDALEDAEKTADRQLYLLLALVCKGNALAVVKRVPSGCGFEVWRLLCGRFEPRDGTTSLGMLQAISSFQFGGDLAALPERLDEYRVLVRDYEIPMSRRRSRKT